MVEGQNDSWTIRSLMKSSIAHLQKHGFDEARLNVELLLAHSLSCQRIELYTNFERPLNKVEVEEFRLLCERRLRHEPVQYIIGSTSFMGLQLKVDPRVLIPRPETETLVEQAMLVCNSLNEEGRINIIDVGTGSGNIAIALAKFVKNSFVTGIDNSESALEVATLNRKLHGMESRVDLREIDVSEPVDQLLRRRFDILVSNPPYVPPDEWECLKPEVRDFEPRSATTDSKDGLEFYRRISELAPYLLLDKGTVLLEVGDTQASSVGMMIEEAGFFEIAFVKDLQGVNRVVMGRCRAQSRNPVVSN